MDTCKRLPGVRRQINLIVGQRQQTHFAFPTGIGAKERKEARFQSSS